MKLTVYDVNTSLPVIPGAGKTRSRNDDVIVSVTVDVTADQMPTHYVIQGQRQCQGHFLLLEFVNHRIRRKCIGDKY